LSPPNEELPVSVQPWFQVRRDTVRFRLETTGFVDVFIALERPEDRCPARTILDPERAVVSRAWPDDPGTAPVPDLPGEYTVHSLEIGDLSGAEPTAWTALTGPDPATSPAGTIPVPPGPNVPGTYVFFGSLGPDGLDAVVGAAAEVSPDMVFLTGDLQRRDDPRSTWRGVFGSLQPLAARTLIHTAWGANDDEDDDEFAQMASRWFTGQGRPGGTDRYYAVDGSGVRFLVIDSEDDRLTTAGSPQRKWIADEVGDLVTNPDLREVVIVMHRGPDSLAPERPFVELRDTLLPELQAAGVRLVISGLGNGYQRFERSGLVIVDDGGGGSPLADMDARVTNDADGVAARQVSSPSYGFVRLEVASDGALTLTRLDVSGGEVDRVELPPR
jgi:hypothetical protein